MTTTTALHLRFSADRRYRVVGDPPARHQVTADQFGKFVVAGHVTADGLALDGPVGTSVRYTVDVDEDTGLIWLTLVEEG